jgi:hypothetical protein
LRVSCGAILIGWHRLACGARLADASPPMKRLPVESSSLSSVGYDESSRTLEVQFVHGAIYVYSGVPPEVHEGLMAAESKGRYLNSEIRDVYECFKVPKRMMNRWNSRN